jgi:alpha-L-rhamnosidase
MMQPERLSTEHLGDDILGLCVPRPRISWWLPAGTARQAAYEVELDDGRRTRVESDRHVLVEWPFDDLRSRESVGWRVRTLTDVGLSEWSHRAQLEVGLLDRHEWSARWIEPDEGHRRAPGRRPGWQLRHEFVLDGVSPNARLYATAHGVYEAFLNGRRVGDHELSPGFTSYESNLHVQAHDVTDLLVAGPNVWDVTLSDGWYRGQHGTHQLADGFGTSVAFLGQLEVGGRKVLSGAGWVATTGPILSADLMAGQVEDRRIEPARWQPVLIADHDYEALTSSPAPPMRRVQELRPIRIAPLDRSRQVIDLGQNINGRIRLRRLGPAGTDLTLVHGEALDERGDVTLEHLDLTESRVFQVDRIVSAGRHDDEFEPRHTVHGFQYVRIEGHPEQLTPEDAVGVVVHSDLRRTGSFRCSDDRLNRLHDIADWSFRDNACDIPTDCPQRERSGWTGDWQLFAPTAAFLYDVAGFSTKWLRDLAAEQMPDGLLPNYVPDPRRRRALDEGDLTWFGLLGSAGWGDACVLVPWELYRHYGDDAILAEMWPTMRRWLEYAATAARTRRHAGRAERRPDPAPHEEYLWDGGWQWGEWCEPDTGGEPWWSADQGHVATAYLHRTASLAARIGRLLGKPDVARLDEVAAGALDAWRTEYVADDGSLEPDTQANHVRALAFELVPGELRDQTARRLVELIGDAGNHLGTGFLATPHLLPVLADAGHLGVAYDLLLQDTPPSWLTMIDRGATTIWEDWEGIDEHGRAHASLNHYSKGSVISFLHRYVAGIQPVDGAVAYERFQIAPQPGGGITWAEARLDSPQGRIESSWRIEGQTLRLEVAVPPGATADVVLPDGSTVAVGPGASDHACRLP